MKAVQIFVAILCLNIIRGQNIYRPAPKFPINSCQPGPRVENHFKDSYVVNIISGPPLAINVDGASLPVSAKSNEFYNEIQAVIRKFFPSFAPPAPPKTIIAPTKAPTKASPEKQLDLLDADELLQSTLAMLSEFLSADEIEQVTEPAVNFVQDVLGIVQQNRNNQLTAVKPVSGALAVIPSLTKETVPTPGAP